MSTSYVWVCDARREYIDPYPLDAPHLFVMAREDWSGLPIRLLSDFGGGNDEYYLRTSKDEIDADAFGGTLADAYADVTATARALAEQYFTDRWWKK